jgi:tagaturonate reductase
MSKFKTRDLPSLLEYYNRKQKLPEKLVFSLAALIAFYKGRRGEADIPLADDQDVLELFAQQWSMYDGSFESITSIVKNVLSYEKVWELDLNTVPRLTEVIAKNLHEIQTKGMKEAVQGILLQTSSI